MASRWVLRSLAGMVSATNLTWESENVSWGESRIWTRVPTDQLTACPTDWLTDRRIDLQRTANTTSFFSTHFLLWCVSWLSFCMNVFQWCHKCIWLSQEGLLMMARQFTKPGYPAIQIAATNHSYSYRSQWHQVWIFQPPRRWWWLLVSDSLVKVEEVLPLLMMYIFKLYWDELDMRIYICKHNIRVPLFW